MMNELVKEISSEMKINKKNILLFLNIVSIINYFKN